MMARSCRSRAMTLREIAAAMHDPHTRQALLRQAATWDDMAASAERKVAETGIGAPDAH